MTRFVIGPDVALRLADDRAVLNEGHQLLAPTLLRSQLLTLLYQAVRRGALSKQDAERRLDYVRGLRIRLLGAPINHLLRVLEVVTAIGGVGLIFASGYQEGDEPSVAP